MMLLFPVCAVAAQYSTISQYLNHFDTHSTTDFNQRFYVDDSYFNGSGNAVVLFVGGFKPITGYDLKSPVIQELLNASGALLLGLEHRCFGESRPTGGLSEDNRRYCTIEQSLADIDEFISYADNTYCNGKCRVVLLGTFYSGSLAAWFKMRYPQKSSGAWASSAPVQMVSDFRDYDRFIAEKLDNYSHSCFQNMKAGLDAAHAKIASGSETEISQMKALFGFDASQDDISFLYVLAEGLSLPIEDNHMDTVSQMCSALEKSQTLDSLASAFSIALDSLQKTQKSLDPLLFSESDDSYPRLFLSCNQIGWFTTASGKFRSDYINMSYFDRVCNHHFQRNACDASFTNSRFGGVDPGVSSAVFTYGNTDPWAQLSVQRRETVMGRSSFLIEGGGESDDLFLTQDKPSESLAYVRNYSINKMKSWVLDECEKYCKMGECILQKCVCIDMWDGEYCDQQTHTLVAFRWITSIAILLPTGFIILISMMVWSCGNEKDKAQKPTTFT